MGILKKKSREIKTAIEQKVVFLLRTRMLRQQLVSLTEFVRKMRSAPGVWYTGGYYEKIYQYV